MSPCSVRRPPASVAYRTPPRPKSQTIGTTQELELCLLSMEQLEVSQPNINTQKTSIFFQHVLLLVEPYTQNTQMMTTTYQLAFLHVCTYEVTQFLLSVHL